MNNISWYVENIKTNDYYAGNIANETTIYITAWNNRAGDINKPNLIKPTLICHYKHDEDTILINRTNVEVLNNNDFAVSKTHDSIIIKFNNTLSGTINDGEESIINNNNFIKIKLTINLKDLNLKEEDLKELYLEIK